MKKFQKFPIHVSHWINNFAKLRKWKFTQPPFYLDTVQCAMCIVPTGGNTIHVKERYRRGRCPWQIWSWFWTCVHCSMPMVHHFLQIFPDQIGVKIPDPSTILIHNAVVNCKQFADKALVWKHGTQRIYISDRRVSPPPSLSRGSTLPTSLRSVCSILQYCTRTCPSV